MIRATQKSVKFIAYAVALITGAVLVLFGIQAKNGSSDVATGSQPNLLGETAKADHLTGGDSTPWGFDGDDGGGDDGGGDDDGPN